MARDSFAQAMQSILSPQEFQEFEESLQKPLKKTIKILNSRMPVDKFQHLVALRGRQLTSTHFTQLEDMFYIDRDDTSIPLGKTFLHLLGFFYMQELAASIPAHFLDIPQDGVVLDMSAAPGGKTVQLADYALSQGSRATIIANDMNARRLPALGSNLTRTAMYNTAITKYNGAMFGTNHPEFFDSILLDAPCSGEGTGFKSDAAYKRRKQSSIEKIARTQEMLLTSAIKACKPGGHIVYSTCTLNPIENEQNIQKLLYKYGSHISIEPLLLDNTQHGVTDFMGLSITSQTIADSCIRCRPHRQHTGGFFVAKIHKKDSLGSVHFTPALNQQTIHYFDISHSTQTQIATYMEQNFGFTPDEKFLFVRTPKHVYVTSKSFAMAHPYFAFDRVGVPVLKGGGLHDRRPEHAFGIIFGEYATKRTIDIALNNIQDYVQYHDISLDDLDFFQDEGEGYYVLKRQDRGVGVAKRIGNILKNKFIKIN